MTHETSTRTGRCESCGLLAHLWLIGGFWICSGCHYRHSGGI